MGTDILEASDNKFQPQNIFVIPFILLFLMNIYYVPSTKFVLSKHSHQMVASLGVYH